MSQQGLRFTLDVDGLLAMSTAVVSFTLSQNLSTPFLLCVDIASGLPDLTATDFLEKNATLTVWQGAVALRYLHGIITGVANVNGAEFGYEKSLSAVMAYDATVLAGTQGKRSHIKTDRLVERAQRDELPFILFAEGGGGRPGDTDTPVVAGLHVHTFAAYAALSAVWAQTEEDAARLRSVGAPVAGVFGNLKFDVEPSATQLAQGRGWRQASLHPVVLLASSREGEEALWLQAWRSTPAAQQVQWLIVPRHPQRFDAVAHLLRTTGFAVKRRSTGQTDPDDGRQVVWLGDSMVKCPCTTPRQTWP